MNWADETENEELERERQREIEKENAPVAPEESTTEHPVDSQQNDHQQQSSDNQQQNNNVERTHNNDRNYDNNDRRGGYNNNYNNDRRGGYNNDRRGGYNNDRQYNNRDGGYNNNKNYVEGGYKNNQYNNNRNNNKYDNRGGDRQYNNNRPYVDYKRNEHAVALYGYETTPTQEEIFEFISANITEGAQLNIATIEVTPKTTYIALKDLESYETLIQVNGKVFKGKEIQIRGQNVNKGYDNKPRYQQQQQQQQHGQSQPTSFGQPSDRPKSDPFGGATPVDTDRALRERSTDGPSNGEPKEIQQRDGPRQEPYRPPKGDMNRGGAFRKSNDSQPTLNNSHDNQRNDKFRKDFGNNKKGGFENMKPKKPVVDEDGWTTTSGKGGPKDVAKVKTVPAPVAKKEAVHNKFASLEIEDDE